MGAPSPNASCTSERRLTIRGWFVQSAIIRRVFLSAASIIEKVCVRYVGISLRFVGALNLPPPCPSILRRRPLLPCYALSRSDSCLRDCCQQPPLTSRGGGPWPCRAAGTPAALPATTADHHRKVCIIMTAPATETATTGMQGAPAERGAGEPLDMPHRCRSALARAQGLDAVAPRPGRSGLGLARRCLDPAPLRRK